MSVGSISGSGYEAMRARFDSFRSGSTRIQKADLEQAKTAAVSKSSSEAGSTKGATGSRGIDELIEKFSQIDANGDGISADELDSAVEAGTVSQPQPPGGGGPAGGMKGPPPGGPPPGGPPPGGKGGAKQAGGTSQSDLMAYDLFEEYKKKLQADSAITATTSLTDATETSEADEADEADDTTSSTSSADSIETLTGQETLDLLAMWGKKSAGNSRSDAETSDSGNSKGKGLAASLIQQLLKTYQQQASGISSEAASSLGAGIVA